MSIQRYAYSIFCDDVRQEIANKVSYMGVYERDIIVYGTPPITLPQFSIVIAACTPIETPFQQLKFRIEMPATDPITGEIELSHKFEQEELDADSIKLKGVFKLSPFPIMEEGFIRLRIDADGEELKAGSLRIQFQPTENECA